MTIVSAFLDDDVLDAGKAKLLSTLEYISIEGSREDEMFV